MFTIEKGIFVLAITSGCFIFYPLGSMDVGDSFFIPLPEGKKHRDLQSSVSRAAKAHEGKKFTTRKAVSPDGGADGVRVWRVA